MEALFKNLCLGKWINPSFLFCLCNCFCNMNNYGCLWDHLLSLILRYEQSWNQMAWSFILLNVISASSKDFIKLLFFQYMFKLLCDFFFLLYCWNDIFLVETWLCMQCFSKGFGSRVSIAFINFTIKLWNYYDNILHIQVLELVYTLVSNWTWTKFKIDPQYVVFFFIIYTSSNFL